MERIGSIPAAAGAIVLSVFLCAAAALAVEAPNAGNQQAGAAGQPEQTAPERPTQARPPTGMGPMGGMRMGRGIMMAHPCSCSGRGMGPGMGRPMMCGMGGHGMMGMGMLMAARRDPKGVARMMRMRADMLKLRARMLEGKASVLEKYANEIEAGSK
jgi:hypothetical protein